MRERAGSIPPMTSTTTWSGVGDDGLAVLCEPVLRERDVTIAAEVANGHSSHFEVHAGPLRDQLGVVLEQPHQCRADVPAPEQADSYSFLGDEIGHHASLALYA